MRIVFFGTSPFSASILQYLIDHDQDVVGVVTRPDRPKGRSQKMQCSAVKSLVQEKWPKLSLFHPEKASTIEFEKTLIALEPDLYVVVAYGEIIKQNLLDIPKILPINIHASLLPKYRGAAPIQRAIMNGEVESGVTIMEMVLKMDAGSILKVSKTPIDEEMNFHQLEEKLCQLSGPALLDVLENIELGTLQKIPQKDEGVTYAPKISGDDRKIDWNRSATDIHNQIRGLSPSPGAYCEVEVGGSKKRLGIKKTKKLLDLSGLPGQTISCENQWIVACAEGALSLLEVQLEGKKTLGISDFLKGQSVPSINRLA